jgi:CHASE2 domain-containing sensor protein
VNLQTFSSRKHFRAVAGAAFAISSGLMLWLTPLGRWWVNASYDVSALAGAKMLSKRVTLVLMDNAAHRELHQDYGKPWNRGFHGELLNKLESDGCPLVVFDMFFEEPGEPTSDELLASAMRKHRRVVLGTELVGPQYPGAEMARVVPLYKPFLDAAAATGVARTDANDYRDTARRHWPFPASGEAIIRSLPWVAAELNGAQLSTQEEEQWLRYYGSKGAWDSMSYHLALSNAPGYFSNKVVFVGREPEQKANPDYEEPDKFRTPYTRWNSQAAGGVEILATTFLNLTNGDWLRRPAWPVEVFVFFASGLLLGGGLPRLRRTLAFAAAIAFAVAVAIAGLYLVRFTNYWFPWLVVVGGQLPCALGWALVSAKVQTQRQPVAQKPGPTGTIRLNFPEEELPDAPEYEIITPAIGKGGFGKVWMVRNAIGQWQALKAIYETNFGGNRECYEAEFKGLHRYKPVSERHPGLLRIELVSKLKETGYYYYVMELGDAQHAGWEKQPSLYKPKDLENLRRQAYGRRLPAKECLRIVTILADALEFLHQQGLTHRDIKPSNVIFVNGRPKLADIGLVADIRPPEQIHTSVGTLGYMPPKPEKPGTVQADIYALGMLLYVISTGRDPDLFPDLSTVLMESSGHADFMRLNAIIRNACQPDLAHRYQATAEMLRDLSAINNL